MGCCTSSTDIVEDLKKEHELNRQITSYLQEDRRKSILGPKKLLLLGTSFSGKTTFFKQLLHTYNTNNNENNEIFTNKLQITKKTIDFNILQQMKNLINNYQKLDDYSISSSENSIEISENKEFENNINFINDISTNTPIDTKIGASIESIWNNKQIKQTYKKRDSLKINDSCNYFFNNIKRISGSNYIPTKEDTIFVTIPSNKIIDYKFKVKDMWFHIFDTFGNKTIRSKLSHIFDDVEALIFIASLSCYDETLFEDDKTNAMKDQILYFKEIINNKYFKYTCFILFLNKNDLFEEKIKLKALNICFKDYNGSNEYTECLDFIKQKFIQQINNHKEIRVYSHITCAIDTENMIKIFNDVQTHIIHKSLAKTGLF